MESLDTLHGAFPRNYPRGSIPSAAVSAFGGENGNLLGLKDNVAQWVDRDYIISILGTIPVGGISTFVRGDLLVAQDTTSLDTIEAVGGSVALFSDTVHEYPNYRRITAADVDSGTFPGTGTYSFNSHLFPAIDATYDLGSTSFRWRQGLFSSAVIIGTLSAFVTPFAQFAASGISWFNTADPLITISRARAGPAAVQSGDILAEIVARGYGTTMTTVASIRFTATETHTSTNHGSKIAFSVAPTGGGSSAIRWNILSTAFYPETNNAVDIGTSSLRVKKGYFVDLDFSGTLTGSGAALTRVDDTNVTLTLGGSPNTALINATSITVGWTGQLGLARGGTNADLSATGGASRVLKQTSVGAAITVAQLAFSDLSGNLTYSQLPTGGGTWANGGTLSITGGVTTVAGLTSTDDISLTNELIFTTTSGIIRRNTADASDNSFIQITGGGAAGSNRGGVITIYGNEAISPGAITINSGTVNNTGIQLAATNTVPQQSIFILEPQGIALTTLGLPTGAFSGVLVFFMENATTVPSANPTNGGYVYVESGALKYRGSSGTISTLAAA